MKHITNDESTSDFMDAMDDVHTRFVLNLPPQELSTSDRLFFQLEQAWWFYDDFLCDLEEKREEDDDDDDDDDEEEEQDEDEKDKHKKSNQNLKDKTSTRKKSDGESEVAGVTTTTTTTTTNSLPRFKNLRTFSKAMFKFSPLLNHMIPKFESMWEEFASYRRRIATYGTIILNQQGTKVALCEDWNSGSWTFPAGKVNQNEMGIDAGARETYEETGFDPNCNQGLTKTMLADSIEKGFSLPWQPGLKEEDALSYVEDGGKKRTCYVCRGVPESFPFEPVCRKEVRCVQWHLMDELPKKTFAVLPFIQQLRRWIRKDNKRERQRKKRDGTLTGKNGNSNTIRDITPKNSSRNATPINKSRPNSNSRGTNNIHSNNNHHNRKNSNSRSSSNPRGNRSRSNSEKSSRGRASRGRASQNNNNNARINAESDLVKSGLVSEGESERWTEEEMFKTNEQLIGRPVKYDGNPQAFASGGFFDGGIDPHAFRVVGGSFMNSSNGDKIAHAPDPKMLQPLHRKVEKDGTGESNPKTLLSSDDDGLRPFFSNDGETPWGDIVAEALAEDVAASTSSGHELSHTKKAGNKKEQKETLYPSSQPSSITVSSNASGLQILNMLNSTAAQKNQAKTSNTSKNTPQNSNVDADNESSDRNLDSHGFMTDSEITNRSENRYKELDQIGSMKCKDELISHSKDNKEVTLAMKINTSTAQIDREEQEKINEDVLSTKKTEVAPSEYFGDFRFNVDAIMISIRCTIKMKSRMTER